MKSEVKVKMISIERERMRCKRQRCILRARNKSEKQLSLRQKSGCVSTRTMCCRIRQSERQEWMSKRSAGEARWTTHKKMSEKRKCCDRKSFRIRMCRHWCLWTVQGTPQSKKTLIDDIFGDQASRLTVMNCLPTFSCDALSSRRWRLDLEFSPSL